MRRATFPSFLRETFSTLTRASQKRTSGMRQFVVKKIPFNLFRIRSSGIFWQRM